MVLRKPEPFVYKITLKSNSLPSNASGSLIARQYELNPSLIKEHSVGIAQLPSFFVLLIFKYYYLFRKWHNPNITLS